jgi:carotenoid cleavage dioxygenase-like enzyme
LLKGVPLIHDFALAGKYLVFCISPVRLNILPLLARVKSYSEALEWHPELGTEILIVDRETLEVVSRSEVDPWYQWHFANGCESSDGSLSISLVRFPDFQTNQNLKEVASGRIETPAKGTLWDLRIDSQSARLLEMNQSVSRGCEFPTLQPQDVGQPWRYSYLAVRHPDRADDDYELFGAIARFDHQTGILTETNIGVNYYPGEPIYAPDTQNVEKGWILTIIYDGNRDASEVWIYDANRLDGEPICRLALPEIIPLGFHGTWQPA